MTLTNIEKEPRHAICDPLRRSAVFKALLIVMGSAGEHLRASNAGRSRASPCLFALAVVFELWQRLECVLGRPWQHDLFVLHLQRAERHNDVFGAHAKEAAH